MTGKQKCKILKEIRRQIAEANDIRFVIEECSHKGKCKGTCPRCEWEVRELEKALEKRRLSGKKVALAGISAGMIVSSATACTPIETISNLIHGELGGNPLALEGDVPYIPESETEPYLMGETEKIETRMGKPVVVEPLEGDPVLETSDIPGEIVEVDGLFEPPEDIREFAGVPVYPEETEPEWDDELFLEGDIAYPEIELAGIYEIPETEEIQ